MTARQHRIKHIPRADYAGHERKARGFPSTMKSSLEDGYWDAASLNAVHCAISAADALLVKHAGLRSASEVHSEAAALLELHIKDEQIRPKAKSLAKILSYKHVAAYEAREITEAEARELAKLTERFYDWATALLK